MRNYKTVFKSTASFYVLITNVWPCLSSSSPRLVIVHLSCWHLLKNKSFKFWWSPLYSFFSSLYFLCYIFKIFPTPKSLRSSLMFPFRSFVVLVYILRSVIHFKSTLCTVWGKGWGSFFKNMILPLFQHYLLNILSPLNFSDIFAKHYLYVWICFYTLLCFNDLFVTFTPHLLEY